MHIAMDREFYECERLDRQIQRCDMFITLINESAEKFLKLRNSIDSAVGKKYSKTELAEECNFIQRNLAALQKLLAKTNEIKDGQIIIDVNGISEKVDEVCNSQN